MPKPSQAPKKANRRNNATAVAIHPTQVGVLIRRAPVGAASEAIGKLVPGQLLYCVTKGQFSMLELIRAVVEQVGAADVTVATWTFGIRDAEMASWLVSHGHLKSLRFLCDYSFVSREPKYSARIQELFGKESIVLTKIHAKFAVIRADGWAIAITGSLNLNRNPRWEHFTLHDCPSACDYFDKIRDELQGMTGAGWDASVPAIQAAFDAADMEGINATERLISRLEQKEQERAAKAEWVAQKAKPVAEPLPDPSSIEIPASASAMLEAQYRLASVQEHGANQDHSWVAAGQFASLKVKLYRELMAARKAEGAGALTEAQFFAQLEERVAGMSTAHLEVAVREYLSRHPGMRLAGG